MSFRDRLIATLKAARPLLEEPGVLVVGSEVPNLLEPDAASTLVVSQDVDLGIPVSGVERIKARLGEVRGLTRSAEEPSVWVPETEELIELNLLGLDPNMADPTKSYVRDDPELPLMVFGPLSLVRPGRLIRAAGLSIPLPRPAGLIAEKLLTDRSGVKGERDLLVVAGLLAACAPADLDEFVTLCAGLAPELRYAIRSNLTVLSLMQPSPHMPDPLPQRELVARLLSRLEASRT